MSKFTRREWIKPAMLVFGAQAVFADKEGSKNSESVTRYGSSCGIRSGTKCKPTRTGNSCRPTRTGTKCK